MARGLVRRDHDRHLGTDSHPPDPRRAQDTKRTPTPGPVVEDTSNLFLRRPPFVGYKLLVSRQRPPLNLLATFLAVYKSGSLSAAARTLGVSQPTVTNHLRMLEDWYGTDLFTRESSGVRPTALGTEIASAIAIHIESLERSLGQGEHIAQGQRRVVIGGSLELISGIIAPTLRHNSTKLPRIDFTFGRSQSLLEGLLDGAVDLVVSSVRPRDESLVAQPIADEEFWLVAAPSLPITGTSTSALSALPIVALGEDLPIIRRYWNTVYGVEPLFNPAVVLPELTAIRAAVVAGVGVSVLPDHLVADDLRLGLLCRIDPPEEPPMNTVFLVMRRSFLQIRGGVVNGLARYILTQLRAGATD
ncbi:LysR family transcriptional regulator [Gordonia lacunae]|uniref:LysR family transcriptional regulator n=1 Tax=Gordonia TaxID=2053 RepID=UPI00200B5B62|nr:LysR family transcriptional regulator [Gordonia terrae]UPW11974.1 LysR family transcriptional regulator [Gordonia terrae]